MFDNLTSSYIEKKTKCFLCDLHSYLPSPLWGSVALL